MADLARSEQNGWSSAIRGVSIFAVALLAAFEVARAGPTMASLAGVYDGGQIEIAAALELNANGRFRYELAYGALDEEAEGQWALQAGGISLTSDPVRPPVFTLVSQTQGPEGVLKITMDFKDLYDQQYFDALIQKADGATEEEQLGLDGLLWRFPAGAPPKSVRLLYPLFELVSDPLNIDMSAGAALTYHFEANDIGKVAFKATPLRIVDGELWLERHGRQLKFRRVKG